LEIIPAIDLREGACARLLGDNSPAEGVYSDDPIEQAIILKGMGAEWVHITDLDGAFSGHLCNLRIIQEMVEMSGVRIQHSGGVRSIEHVDTLISLGVDRVVLGVALLRNAELTRRLFEKYGERIVPGVDGRDGMVAIEGFETSAATSVLKLLEQIREIGITRIVYTDLRRYGTMKGPNFEGIQEMLQSSDLRLMIAGGINSYQAIERLRDMGAEALIIGKALYSGAIDLKQAQALL
jgi:phosphoribosylformimino-5-aminoimidazole carboxamide ribotide isomerase